MALVRRYIHGLVFLTESDTRLYSFLSAGVHLHLSDSRNQGLVSHPHYRYNIQLRFPAELHISGQRQQMGWDGASILYHL